MKIIGFSFTKISAEKMQRVVKASLNTDIVFTNVEREDMELLKDSEALKISFKYSLTYDGAEKKPVRQGEVIFEGYTIVAVDKEEMKNILKAWKNKHFPDALKVPLFNLILKKCTPKAVYLQDEISLPFHIPMPRIAPESK